MNSVMRETIRKVLKNPDTNVVIGMTPREASDALKDYKWNIVQDYLAESREDWSCAEYVSEYCPEFKIIMQWNSWTGQVELVATRVEEEDPLMKGLRKVLYTIHDVVSYQNYDLIEINKFIEDQGWELCRATATIRRGWCHYIYRNVIYPDRKLVLAWEPELNIIELRTMLNYEVEDE